LSKRRETLKTQAGQVLHEAVKMALGAASGGSIA
jgi:hypothetical protein